jgi:hypothetical protein
MTTVGRRYLEKFMQKVTKSRTVFSFAYRNMLTSCVCVIQNKSKKTALFISVEECKPTWVKIRSYCSKALCMRESTDGQTAKWRFEEQMPFPQN